MISCDSDNELSHCVKSKTYIHELKLNPKLYVRKKTPQLTISPTIKVFQEAPFPKTQ